MAAGNHIVTAIMSVRFRACLYISYQRKQASFAPRQLSTVGQALSDWPVLRSATFKVYLYLKSLDARLIDQGIALRARG